MLTCYIIDDEMHAIRGLIAYLEKTPFLQLAGYNNDPLKALSYFTETGQYPDITFLDIDMPNLSGLELAALLKGKTAIVFTTAHTDFALTAFDLEIHDYLLKPFPYHRFLKCVEKLSRQLMPPAPKVPDQEAEFFYIQTEGKGKVIKLNFQNIRFIEGQKNYVSITTDTKTHLTYLTLSELEEKLPACFIRVGKSIIVNVNHISHLEGNTVYLEGVKDPFAIGASYRETFFRHVKEHLIKTKRNP